MAASIRNPIVVIIGATGTGKTKLSLELAKLFNGEIISADAMQLYKGLDIITNKATAEERQTCKHHMIDYLSPLKENSTVVDYRDQAVPIIDSLLEQQKTPVIIGGTNYYVEALLWKLLVNKEDVKRAALHTSGTQMKFPKLQVVKKISEEIEACKNEKSLEQSGSNCDIPSLSSSSSSADVGNNNDDNDEKDERHEINKDTDQGSNTDTMKNTSRDRYNKMSSAELYQRLKELDPESAMRFHPHDRRKVLRALEVYDKHGIPMSQVYRAQQQDLPRQSVSGPLRYKDCCVFWLQCEQDVLDKRLDERVDKMLELGLLEELTDFHRKYNEDRIQQGNEPDYTRGIFQSIGFKEFHDYLILSEEDRHSEAGRKALQIGIDELKKVTRRYARYQNRWVKNRFLKRPCSDVPPVYGLDCTDVSLWEENISAPAASILTALRKREESPISPLPFEEKQMQEYEFKECKHCNVTTVIKSVWEKHIGSRKHKNSVRHYRNQMAKLTQTLDTYVKQKKSEEDQEKTAGSLHQH